MYDVLFDFFNGLPVKNGCYVDLDPLDKLYHNILLNALFYANADFSKLADIHTYLFVV